MPVAKVKTGKRDAQWSEALTKMIREVTRQEVAGRAVFCRPGAHFVLADDCHVEACGVCVWTVAVCEEHGGKENAQRRARGHVAWQGGKIGRRMYGDLHSEVRQNLARGRRK